MLKNLEITHDHFQNLYDKTPAYYDVYDSKKVSHLRSFASSNNIQILVINIDSFAKDENIINRENDKLTGKKPIEFIQSTNPIVIVDEPQNMETDKRKKAIGNLNPLCTLRYSATHLDFYNLIYKLDPVKAYDLGLVKQIEVDSIYATASKNLAFIKVEDIKTAKTKITAKIKIEYNTDEGVKKKSLRVKNGDDIFELSNNREQYQNQFIVTEIDANQGKISFANGIEVGVGQTHGGFTDEIMKFQIQQTIEEHLRKEKALRPLGLKVLSLIFIDRVANYRKYVNGNAEKGKFSLWFEEIYNKLISKPGYRNLIKQSVDAIHEGYFSIDKKGKVKDTKGESKADDDTYQLIMKDKERLLDINEPLRFIFSHSALREGWDNPNVFQICTLNESRSEIKKRQEIGRGLRLPVNQKGERTFDKNINRLTVIANESYEDFAKKLQTEIENECGVDFTGRIKNKRERTKVKLKKNYQFDKNFIELWKRIKDRTSYCVNYNTEKLIEDSAKAVKEMNSVSKPLLVSELYKISIDEEGVGGQVRDQKITRIESETFNIIPDIIGYIQDKTELTRSTILEILKSSKRLNDVFINPQMFLDYTVMKIKGVLNKLMVDGIKYQKVNGKVYEMRLFEDEEIEAYKQNLYKVRNQDKTLYNYIEFESGIEKTFAEDCENNDSIEFYFKLPGWFSIDTPIGKYNPDWALIYRNESRIYFVAETKGSMKDDDLRKKEDMKIK